MTKNQDLGELDLESRLVLLGLSFLIGSFVTMRLLHVAAIKIYFIDLAQTAGVGRVMVLFVFGAMLLAFSFIERGVKNNQLQHLKSVDI